VSAKRSPQNQTTVSSRLSGSSLTEETPLYRAPRDVADFEANSNCYGDETSDMWICGDFRIIKVRLIDYLIRSPYNYINLNLK
jgi:hypothetical protein